MHQTKLCPECGKPMTLGVGIIEEPRLSSTAKGIVRRERLGSFWACHHCEHCEEAR